MHAVGRLLRVKTHDLTVESYVIGVAGCSLSKGIVVGATLLFNVIF
jgi:hypothetical protein